MPPSAWLFPKALSDFDDGSFILFLMLPSYLPTDFIFESFPNNFGEFSHKGGNACMNDAARLVISTFLSYIYELFLLRALSFIHNQLR